jgi:hypothetical protein
LLFPSIQIDDSVTSEEPAIDETQAGRQSDVSDNDENAKSQICSRDDCDSNDKSVKCEHCAKQCGPIYSTLRGRVRVQRPQPEKVRDSILFRAEPFSNDISQSCQQNWKQ